MATEEQSSPEFNLEGIQDVQDFNPVRITVFILPNLLNLQLYSLENEF